MLDGPGQSTGQRREAAGGGEGGKLPFPVGSLAADAQLGGCKPKLESWKSWPQGWQARWESWINREA